MTDQFTKEERELAKWLFKEYSFNRCNIIDNNKTTFKRDDFDINKHTCPLDNETWLLTARELQKKMIRRFRQAENIVWDDAVNVFPDTYLKKYAELMEKLESHFLKGEEK